MIPIIVNMPRLEPMKQAVLYTSMFITYELFLISTEDITCIHFVLNIVQTSIVSIGNDGL